MNFTLTDFIILLVVFILLGLIIFFSLWRNRKNPCKGCAYARNCSSQKLNKKKCQELKKEPKNPK